MVMYKIDRRGGGGVQKSFSRTDPIDRRGGGAKNRSLGNYPNLIGEGGKSRGIQKVFSRV